MNLQQSVTIEPLTETCLADVVRLHRAGLGYSLNSRLGQEHMAFLYRLMARDESCLVALAMRNGRPVGVVSGTLDADRLKTSLLKLLPLTRLISLGLSSLLHPSLFMEWWKEQQIGAPLYHQGKEVSAVLTAIAVDPDAQDRGVGRELVAALERFLAQHKVRAYRLDTLVDNARARGFYSRLGFREVDTRAGSVILLKELAK